MRWKTNSDGRSAYACADGVVVRFQHGRTSAVARDERAYTSGAVCQERRTRGAVLATVSGVQFSRDMTDVVGAVDCVRTVVFPSTARRAEQSLFCGAAGLRSAVLNRGFEDLPSCAFMDSGI